MKTSMRSRPRKPRALSTSDSTRSGLQCGGWHPLAYTTNPSAGRAASHFPTAVAASPSRETFATSSPRPPPATKRSSSLGASGVSGRSTVPKTTRSVTSIACRRGRALSQLELRLDDDPLRRALGGADLVEQQDQALAPDLVEVLP